MLQFKLPAAHFVRVPAGEAQGFSSLRRPRACCHIRPQREQRSSGQPEGGLPLRGGRRWMWEADEAAAHIHVGECDRDQKFPRVGNWASVLDHQVGVVGLAAAVLTLAAVFFLDFPTASLGAAMVLGSDFWVLAVFLVVVTLGFSEASVTGWEGGFGIEVQWGSGLDNTPPSNVTPPLAQVHLLGRGPGPLFFRSGKLGCGGALSATVGRLLCKCGLRLFPLHTAPVVRRVGFPASTALGLFPRGRATTWEVGAPHATHRGA